MKTSVAFMRKPGGIEELISWDKAAKRRTLYVIEKTIDLEKTEFERFSIDLFAEQDFIKENIDRMYVDKNGVWHCILIKAIEESSAILVNAEGYDYPRYAAFIEATDMMRYYLPTNDGKHREVSRDDMVKSLRKDDVDNMEQFAVDNGICELNNAVVTYEE